MSIDARVVGIRKIRGEREVKLTLEDRPGGGPAGQGTLRILKTDELTRLPCWSWTLKKLIGCDIWGGAGSIMLGDSKLADREMYKPGINLVADWADVIDGHCEATQ